MSLQRTICGRWKLDPARMAAEQECAMQRRPLLLLPLLAAASAAAQTPIAFHTAGAGSAFLPYGEGVAAWLGRQGFAVQVERSTGSLQNLSRVEDDPNAVGCAFLGSVKDTLDGTAAAGGRRHTQLAALFPMYETSFQVAAPRRSGITDFAGLAGKRVGVGPSGGPAETFFRLAADTAGLTATTIGGTPTALVEALAKGEIDALWQGAIVPIPSLVAASRQADAQVFGLPPALVAAVVQRAPHLSPSITPPGTYAGQTTALTSFAAWNVVVANAALPDQRAYDLTRLVLAAPDPARDIHPSAAATRAANAPLNRLLPYHPGAARHYAEQGIRLA